MEKGHQNQSSAADPVHMTCPEDIIPRMYPGGFSAVIDASKYFHMILALDEERKIMCVIHPDTGDRYWYTCLHVSSANSPAVSGHFRLICHEVEEMQWEVQINNGGWHWKVAGLTPNLGEDVS
jgi:hypothetical protein